MLRLILDPVRRWWWVLALAYLIAVFSALGGIPFLPFLLAPVGVILLFSDAQTGLIRATAPLPVSLAAQARARWIFAVPFVVGTGVIAMALGVLLRETVISPRPYGSDGHLARAVLLQAELGFGSAGLAFIGLSFVGSRPPETLREYLTQALVATCWAVSFLSFGLYPWFMRYDPVLIGQQWPWYVLAVAAPALVGLSYFSSEAFIRRRSLAPNRKTSQPIRNQTRELEGIGGIPLFLLAVPVRVIVFTLAMTAIQWLTIRFISGQWTSYMNVGLLQFAIFGMFISTFVTEQVSIRVLRTLPISARNLTLLLLSGPCVSALGTALLWIPELLQNGLSLPVVGKVAEMVLLVAGSGALCLAVVLRYVGLGRLAVIVALAIAAPFAVLFLPGIPGAAAAFGVIAGIIGYFLLNNSLRHCSATYQPRKLFGMGQFQPQ